MEIVTAPEASRTNCPSSRISINKLNAAAIIGGDYKISWRFFH